jgi:hypothetical protein
MPGYDARVLYREVQNFRQHWLWILILVIAGFFLYSVVDQLILGELLGNYPAPGIAVLFLAIVFGLGLPILFYKTNLTTEIRTDGLYFRFFPFHLSFQRIPLDEVKKYEVCTYRPIRDYGGWGIRYGAKGKAYNVGGNRGIKLELSSGRQILIGSRSLEELTRSLDLVMKKRGSGTYQKSQNRMVSF